MINLSKFTRLYWVSLIDTNIDVVAAYKFAVDNPYEEGEYVLGYLDTTYWPESVIENLPKGCVYYFNDLSGIITSYLIKKDELGILDEPLVPKNRFQETSS
jgi:hypothetical protein